MLHPFNSPVTLFIEVTKACFSLFTEHVCIDKFPAELHEFLTGENRTQIIQANKLRMRHCVPMVCVCLDRDSRVNLFGIWKRDGSVSLGKKVGHTKVNVKCM